MMPLSRAALRARISELEAELATVNAELVVCNQSNEVAEAEADAMRSVMAADAALIAELRQQLDECMDGGAVEPPPVALLKGAYGRDSSASGIDKMKAVGLNMVTASPDVATLDKLHAQGMQAIIWMGSYNRKAQEGLCEFERSDAWVTERVTAVRGHPAIAMYQVTDEAPGQMEVCPDAPGDMAARNALIKSLDPSKPTYLTCNTGHEWGPFAGTADIFGLVAYPVSNQAGYSATKIPSVIEKARVAGFERYIAVMQAFGNSWYRMPTAAEMQRQFDEWAVAPGYEGYMLYHWQLGNLENLPDHLAVIEGVNA